MNWKEINSKRQLPKKKYEFYEGTYDFEDFSRGKMAKLIPKSRVGWGSRAIEVRGNKTTFDCFENDELGLTEIAKKYHVYEALAKIKEDILVAGCGFMGLVGKRVLPFTAQEASGVFDWEEQNLSFGAAAFSDEKKESGVAPSVDDTPKSYVIYEKTRTRIKLENQAEKEIANQTGRPLMGLFTYRSTTKHPMGRSVLNHAARDAIIDASRTLRQAMIAAYYYNVKVDALLGVDADTEIQRVEGQTGDTVVIGPNSDGEIPKIGEFAQHSMQPFKETIEIAKNSFCATTKLMPSNLGEQSNAPQNPESLEIISDDLRDEIIKWHEELGEQLKYFCLTLYMVDNNLTSIDPNLQAKYEATVPVFKPIYRADVAKVGDSVFKMAEKAPGILLSRRLWRTLGLDSEDIDRVINSVVEKQTTSQL